MSLAACLAILAGGFLGGIGRHALAGLVGRRVRGDFPWGTMAVNVTGALVIGVVAGIARRPDSILSGDLVRDFLIFGLLGGYTTVSAFSLQTLHLMFEGHGAAAAGNVALSVTLCLLATAIGLWAVAAWHGL
ncbi:fluoride efflux transporter CrcB [Phreatobacter sp.]|uniref:fluoride efflux transporter CrcB n=1 Tax=Phreatobacter sp. TaxID=1966341 RepID=UPI003F715740